MDMEERKVAEHLPSALDHVDEIVQQMPLGKAAMFLDFDGTISNLILHPAMARPVAGARPALGLLAWSMPVGIISGRALDDVQRRVDLDHVAYAGSHGLEVKLPGRTGGPIPQARSFQRDVERVRDDLKAALKGLPGLLFEDKPVGVAIHHRRGVEERIPDLAKTVRSVVEPYDGWRIQHGKQVLEILPDLAWDKGRAVQHLFDQFGLDRSASSIFYAGDDRTDEAVFEMLDDDDVGILVGSPDRPTSATYRLEEPDEIVRLLAEVALAVADRADVVTDTRRRSAHRAPSATADPGSSRPTGARRDLRDGA